MGQFYGIDPFLFKIVLFGKKKYISLHARKGIVKFLNVE